MKPYKKLNRDSGVSAYETGRNSITVRFNDGKIYRYTYSSAGRPAIEKMKLLAEAGKGLATFINIHVKENYEIRLK